METRGQHRALTDDTHTFTDQRPLLFGLAYRMLGSVADAEDIIQEAYLRWQLRDEAVVASPKAYLAALVTRLCIDYLRLARVQRETYTGPWLPEPVIAEPAPDLAEVAAQRESLSMAFLVLLEELTPVERAVFLLHDVFGYDFREIAAIVGKGEGNCRQIAWRARRQIQSRRPRFDPDPAQHLRLTEEFIAACTNGDLSGLLAMLAEDATFWGDGGGKVPQAAYRPVVGAQRVAAFLLGTMRKTVAAVQTRLTTVNGQPGFVFTTDRGLTGVVTLDIVDARIQAVRIVANPDKLRGVAPVRAAPDPP
jgi:RNA polymerase sigma-70 factor (ECF subfamily)